MGVAAAAEWYRPGAIPPSGTVWNAFVNVTGNPNVNPETAETYTAGFVYQPSSGRELWDGVTATTYSFGVNFMVTTIQHLKTQATDRLPVVDWKGGLDRLPVRR